RIAARMTAILMHIAGVYITGNQKDLSHVRDDYSQFLQKSRICADNDIKTQEDHADSCMHAIHILRDIYAMTDNILTGSDYRYAFLLMDCLGEKVLLETVRNYTKPFACTPAPHNARGGE